jgi:hypothetical protein
MKTFIPLVIALTLSCSTLALSARPKKAAKHNQAVQTTETNQQPSALTASGSGTQGHLAKWVNSSFLG